MSRSSYQEEVVERAKRLAHRAHRGHVDKAGRPYILHAARVAAAVADDPLAEAIAWLHDVLEDCEEKFQSELVRTMPTPVVMGCMRLDRTWKTADEYYRHIRRNREALRVKLADIADNTDESRLALLDEKTAARLREKYRHALHLLMGRPKGSPK